MLSLHTNLAALQTKANLFGNQKDLTTSLTRLGTGLRINSAMDDAAGLQIASRLDSQSRGMNVAMRNTQNAISMLQTAEGALDEATNITMRMKDLAIQGADATMSTEDLKAINGEFTELKTQLGKIIDDTQFGGTALFKTGGKLEAKAIDFQIGATAADKYSFNASTEVKALTTELAKVGAAAIDDNAKANGEITKADDMLKAITAARSVLGAGANRLDSIYNNLSNMVTNTTAAKGRIMDADFATESANMTTKQMLMQSGTAMLKQSGSMSSMAMSLLG
ncbi:flagellin [Crenobacter caeni]|uniref:Flagellin n=1 Tax=Crenobacter caeni TaxID=2705474 RepID=A0A6B2KRF7_9NEIS|nr:flagellin [Crenobacter caeni]NDV12812.1 Lateral flagellin [Crenobacter caeni]